MKPRKVRLEVWATLNGETGYVWPQITSTPPNFDPKLNKPHRVLRFVSEPYISRLEGTEGSFGTEISDKDTPEVSLLRQRLLESEARRLTLSCCMQKISENYRHSSSCNKSEFVNKPHLKCGCSPPEYIRTIRHTLKADSTTPNALMEVLRKVEKAWMKLGSAAKEAVLVLKTIQEQKLESNLAGPLAKAAHERLHQAYLDFPAIPLRRVTGQSDG